jgi:polysaccharide export outer membrane protein
MDPSVLGPSDSRIGGGTEAYQLAAGDKIRVIVFGEPTLTGEFIIGTNGNLSFPLVGTVDVNGKTTQEASEQLRTMLADGYLRDPKVSMEVLAFRPYYILGEVNKPGQFPYASGLTVLNAVATAEGFSYRAERRVVYIRRAGADKEVPIRITPDLQVFPGDTLRIGERYF